MSLLKEAEILFITPGWADGKNDDSSMVDAEIRTSVPSLGIMKMIQQRRQMITL